MLHSAVDEHISILGFTIDSYNKLFECCFQSRNPCKESKY